MRDEFKHRVPDEDAGEVGVMQEDGFNFPTFHIFSSGKLAVDHIIGKRSVDNSDDWDDAYDALCPSSPDWTGWWRSDRSDYKWTVCDGLPATIDHTIDDSDERQRHDEDFEDRKR